MSGLRRNLLSAVTSQLRACDRKVPAGQNSGHVSREPFQANHKRVVLGSVDSDGQAPPTHDCALACPCEIHNCLISMYWRRMCLLVIPKANHLQ